MGGNMTQNLVIVESPTKSKTIEKILGKNYKVLASMGHLRDLPKSQFGVDVDNDFTPKYINIRGKGELIKKLRTAAKKADKVYLATDPDREGEAIAWHLAHILKLNLNEKCRIDFNEITSKAVKEAIKNPKLIDINMVDAQQARRMLDRIVGYKLSPLLWRKIRKGLSAGRVQSVAVKIICDRQTEIDNFVSQEYWSLAVQLREEAKKPLFIADLIKEDDKKITINNKEDVDKIVNNLKNSTYLVKDSQSKKRIRKPYPPFTTSSLQQEAVKKINFSIKKTMMVAQKLYEGISIGRKGLTGLITYMRTDSVRFSSAAQEEIKDFILDNYGEAYVPKKYNTYSSKKNAQDAHEAIRPTSILRTPESLAKYLSKDELKLYTLIWKRAVASQMTVAQYDVTTLNITADKYLFRATGSILKFDGFLILNDRKEKNAEKNTIVPLIEKGKEVLLNKILPPVQHFTEPPAYFTEASLVKELEEKGIGRPSTYAPTIQTILSRRYVIKEGKKLYPTELGELTIDLLTKYFKDLITIPFSANLEASLDKVADNKIDKNDVLSEFYKPFAKSLEVAEKEIPIVEIPLVVTDIPCEKCGRMMVIRQGRFGDFIACPGFPECRNTKPIIKKIGVKCPKCGGEIIERKSKRGRIFYGCENYPKCDFTSWDKPLNELCPKCNSLMYERKERGNKTKKYCSNEDCELALKHKGDKK
jgi:DNA topoisomerase-1